MNKGFTLVELLVSISIFTLITSMAVYNHSQFNGSVLLTNLAYEIGLSIRQAQFYGISVRQNTLQQFDSGYGIHFDMSSSANQVKYTLFEDKSGSSIHIHDGSDNDLQTYTIGKGNRISKICVDGTCQTNGTIDITFIRPNPDAYIRANGLSQAYGKVQICVSSPQSIVRRVTVESTGQISVSTDDPPAVCN